MQYFEYKSRRADNGKVYKGIITADNIENAETEFNYMDTINGNINQGTIIIRNRVGNTSIAVKKKWLTYTQQMKIFIIFG